MKARLYIDVEFNGRKTDAEGVASAFDRVARTGMSALGEDCWDEYGGAPQSGQFLVLDTGQAAELAEELDHLIDGQEDELGKSLAPVRDFLRQIAGKSAVPARACFVEEAIEGLKESYPELNDPAYANAVARKVETPDTGNDQADYENVRDQVERLVRHRI